MRPSRPTIGIMSGVAIATSKSVEALLDALGEILGADEVGAGLLGLARLVALGEDGDRDVLAEPVAAARSCRAAARRRGGRSGRCGRAPRPTRRTSRCASCLTSATASAGAYSRSRSIALRGLEVALAVRRLIRRTSTPIERAVPAMIFVAASMSLALRSCIFCSAIARSCAWVIVPTLVRLRLGRALVDAERLLDQHGGRRRLGDERERAVLVDGDHDRDHGAGVALRLRVERLAELHDVDRRAGPAQGRPAAPGWPARRTACSLIVVRTFLAIVGPRAS